MSWQRISRSRHFSQLRAAFPEQALPIQTWLLERQMLATVNMQVGGSLLMHTRKWLRPKLRCRLPRRSQRMDRVDWFLEDSLQEFPLCHKHSCHTRRRVSELAESGVRRERRVCSQSCAFCLALRVAGGLAQ